MVSGAQKRHATGGEWTASNVPSPALVREAITKLVPQFSGDFWRLESNGMDNQLYAIATPQGKKLLRLSNAADAEELHRKEMVCAAEAEKHGVSTPRYDQQLMIDSWSCIVRDYIEQIPTFAPPQSLVWSSLGAQAGRIHQLLIAGTGLEVLLNQNAYCLENSADALGQPCTVTLRNCDSLRESLQEQTRSDWEHWVDRELAKINSDESLLRAAVLTEHEWDCCQKVIAALRDWSFTPALCHGDLSPENILFSECTRYQIIDWGNAVAHRAPHFDLAEIAVWHDEACWIEPFASGYGTSVSEVSRILDETLPLQLWRVLWAIRRDIERMQESWIHAPFAARSAERLLELKSQLL